MTPDERWPEIAEILSKALDLSEDERPRFLAEVCADDEALRRRLERLIAADAHTDDFLRPVFSLHGDDPEDEAGRRIGPYRLVRPLGRGGMGTVWLAERDDGHFEQRVAVKLLQGFDTEEVLRRFRAERRILARLTHPNVAQLFDGGTAADGRPYFAMEYVEGEPIDQYCDARGLTTRERVRLFRSVCAAVEFAHRNLVVHRDLKPANVLVTGDGVVKLLDFGIAKLLRRDAPAPDPSATATLQPAPMTLQYASPEQVRGEPVTTASDVYSLGVLLYEILTGHRVHRFDTLTPGDVERAVCDTVPPRPSTVVGRPRELRGATQAPESLSRLRGADPRRLRRQLSGDLDNVVMKALRKDPERRFASAEQLSEELGRYLEDRPVRSRPDTLAYRAGKFVRRHAWGVSAAAVLAVLLTGVTALTVTSQARKARLERMDAEIARERQLADGVTSFLVEFLKSADPSRTEGRTLTIREAFDAAVERLGSAPELAPEVRATLADAVGGVYRDRGLFAEARPFLEEALALRRASFGDEHPLVAESLHNLANLELRAGESERAEDRMREAIAIQRRAFPGGHRDLARGLNNLAGLLRRAGRPAEAEVPAREALAMRLSLFGPDHPEVAYALNTLATIRKDQGDVDEAEKLYRRVIEIRRKKAAVTPELANALNNLADLLVEAGRPREALPLHQEALRLRRRLYPDGHAQVVASLNHLALLRLSIGDREEARELFAEAEALAERLPGRPLLDVVRKNQALLAREPSPPAPLPGGEGGPSLPGGLRVTKP